MKLSHWVDRLNSSDSRIHKETVISELLTMALIEDKSSSIFLNLLKFTYDPFMVFGIKKVPYTKDLVDKENPWEDFLALLVDLRSRKITGNLAKKAIESISSKFDSEDWNKVCAQVLKKDIRCGISHKTINKIVEKTKYAIPIFSCQLATSCDNRPEMKGLKRLEPKLDGVRALMMVIPTEGVQVLTYSRNGKLFDNFGHIEDEIKTSFDKMCNASNNVNLTSGFVLDGEIVSKSFNDLMRQARRKENVNALDSTFYIFDIIPLEAFREGHWNTPLKNRVNILERFNPIINQLQYTKLLPSINVDLDTSAGLDQFDRYCKDTVAQGYEGVMIKSLDAPYECKRTTFWLKYKPVITVDLQVIAIEEGTGRNLNRMGALICSGIDQEKQIDVNVGSGFSDVERDEIWKNKNIVVGRTVEILCDAITKNIDNTYSLRFPRFLKFRDDK